MEKELEKDAVCHQFRSTCTANKLTKEALEGLGDFKIGGQIIHTVKYADDLVLLAKEEKVLQDMIDKLTETSGCYRMEMNVEKTKVMRISRQPFPVKIMIVQKQLENVESFKYLGSILTNDGRCACVIKCYIWSIALYGVEIWTLGQ